MSVLVKCGKCLAEMEFENKEQTEDYTISEATCPDGCDTKIIFEVHAPK